MFRDIIENRKLKSKIRSLELELEHERAMRAIFARNLAAVKASAHSLSVEVRKYTYGRRAVNRHEQRISGI